MPQFAYDAYRSPYSESIAESIAAPGRAQAQGVLNAGQAQAAGAQQQGAIWGNALQNVGQTVMKTALELNDPARKLEQARLADLKRQQADLDALDKAYAQPGGREAIINALPGHLRGAVQKQFEEQDRTHAEALKSQTEADRLIADAFADSGAKVREHGYDPHAAQIMISDLKQKYGSLPRYMEQITQAESALRENPTPEGVKAIVDPIIAGSTKRVELDQTKAKDDAAAATAAANSARLADSAAETARHNTELEAIAKTTEGRQARQAAETVRHNLATEKAGGNADAIWVTRDGKPAYISKAEVKDGDIPFSAARSTSETAQDRLRIARVAAARGFLDRLNELRKQINTKMGPAAGVTGMVRRGAAAIGMDPVVAEYEKERRAGGRSLAVAIMGAQNLSDADADAWGQMLPGATIDKDTAERLTTQVGKMLDGLNDELPGPKAGTPPAAVAPTAIWVRDKNGKLVKQ